MNIPDDIINKIESEKHLYEAMGKEDNHDSDDDAAESSQES